MRINEWPNLSLCLKLGLHMRTSLFKRVERLSQKKEEIMSIKEAVLSNEVRAGLLAVSVNSVGTGKW